MDMRQIIPRNRAEQYEKAAGARTAELTSLLSHLAGPFHVRTELGWVAEVVPTVVGLCMLLFPKWAASVFRQVLV